MTSRAAVHIHSDWSHDGTWPLSRLASFFRRVGCRLVLTAEHAESFDSDRWGKYRQACRAASGREIIIVPGMEYSDPSNTLHVLVWGDNMPFLGPVQDIERLLNRVSELRGSAVLAHPSRKDAWQRFDTSWALFLLGIEQWNRKFDGVAPSKEASILLNRNPNLVAFVGLDFHRSNQYFPLTMRLQVGAGLGEGEVMGALRQKRVSAEFLRMPLKHFTGGICGGAMTATDRLRRLARKIIRRGGGVPNKESVV